MSKELDHILKHPDKAINETEGVLARMFRQILLDLNVTWDDMGKRLNAYVVDPRNRIPNDRKIRSSERGNMIKEIARPDMTLKVFYKGIRLLAPIRARFEVHLEWSNRKKTITGFYIPLNPDDDTEV